MRQVQEALRDIGIPVMAGVWRTTSIEQTSPSQYIVYSCTTTEATHEDDRPSCYRTYVYMALWSEIDPTPMRDSVRQAMYDAGFGMVEESDRGYNMPSYDTATQQYSIQWTWCYREVIPYGT